MAGDRRVPGTPDDAGTAPRPAGGPVVVGANWYGCRPGERIRYERVLSLCYIWVRQGSGTISTGGRRHRMSANSLLRLPWGHDVTYEADRGSPFQLGTVHVVPWHSDDVPVEPWVPYSTGGLLPEVAHRRGHPGPDGPLLSSGTTDAGRAVITLATFAVERFATSDFREAVHRPLAELILAEEAGLGRDGPAPTHPARFRLLVDHVGANLTRPVGVSELAEVGRCSEATVQRLFRRWTGMSVLEWVQRRKMEEAATLLRSTGLRVNEVALRVGFRDPLYFSRVFRATFSVAPRDYAASRIRL